MKEKTKNLVESQQFRWGQAKWCSGMPERTIHDEHKTVVIQTEP